MDVYDRIKYMFIVIGHKFPLSCIFTNMILWTV